MTGLPCSVFKNLNSIEQGIKFLVTVIYMTRNLGIDKIVVLLLNHQIKPPQLKH